MVNGPDADQLREIVQEYFFVQGRVIINKDLTVSVDGSIAAIKSMDKMPVTFKTVTGVFNCTGVGLTTLEGSPRRVKGKFLCENNQLTNLKGAPKLVNSFSMRRNPLVSLEGLPELIPAFVLFTYNENLPLLRTLGANDIWPDPDQPLIEKILKQYAGQGKPGAVKCAVELIRAGYKGNARW